MFTPLARLIILGTALALLLAPAGRAASLEGEWLARSWQTEDGLLDNSVAGVAQSGDGYLWIGTPTGLARFDGLRFETVSLTNLIALPNHGIINMITSRSGGLCLAMDRGAVVTLAGRSSRAYVAGLPDLIPCGLAEDGEGGVWVAYRDGSVYCLKDGRITPATEKLGLPPGPGVSALATDNWGRLWVAKAGQVMVLREGKLALVHSLDPQPMRLAPARDGSIWVCCGFHLYKCRAAGNCEDLGEFLPGNPGPGVSGLLEDTEGGVWIATTYNGLYRHDATGFQLIPTSHNAILSLIQDREGNIWAGTYGGGLNRLRRRAVTLEGVDTGLPFNSVLSICEASNHTVWAVTQNGVLVSKTGEQWNSLPVNEQWPGDATCVAAGLPGRVWVGTRTHGLYCWQDGAFVNWGDAAALKGQTLHTLLVSKKDDLWMGQETPSAVLLLRQGKLSTFPISPDSRIIRAMAEDAAGNIWVGTSKGTLLRITGDRLVDETPRPLSGLSSIRCLHAKPDGAIWIGYAGAGVGCIRNGHYFEVNSEQGLFDDYISHIVADDQGWLWFGANRGIFKVRAQDLTDLDAGRGTRVRSVHYGRSEGLASLQGTFGDSPDVLRSHDGRLWIPMQTALVVANPAKLYENAQPPPTLLTRVTVDDRVIARYNGILSGTGEAASAFDLAIPETVLHLSPGPRVVEIEFSALGFAATENIQFRYRLAGLEDDWLPAGTVRKASYQRLQAGQYVFELIACNSDGEWNRTSTRLTIVVAQFFWQTWWFRLAMLLVFTLTLTALVRYVSFRRLRQKLRVLEQQAALQRERARIAKDIHDDLGANLTQIAFLGELANQDRGEPGLVGERMVKISATARQAVKSLDEIVWAVNPRNDTLAHLLDYAGQFAVDYLRLIGIRCRLEFPEVMPVRELSTDLRHNLFLVIKEALHNIFKHAAATEVWVRVRANDAVLEITIEDNGRGFAAAPDDALADGLRNMQQRMAEIGGGFAVESQPGRGTRITLRLPWPTPG